MTSMGRKLPRVTMVRVGPRPLSVEAVFDDGTEAVVDLAAWAKTFDAGELRDPAVAATVRRAYAGSSVAWGPVLDQEGEGPIEISAWQLWRLAKEQAGALMSPDAFRAWRKARKLSQRKAAIALGLSPRMVAYYDDGTWPIPRTVMLACKGYERELAEGR